MSDAPVRNAGIRTKTTTFKHLADKGELGTVLVRLMMFVNDLGVCNDALEQWDKYQDK